MEQQRLLKVMYPACQLVERLTFTAARPAGETLRKRMAAWNRKYPDDWRYKTETNFGRDCKQAIQRLLHPDYGPKIEI